MKRKIAKIYYILRNRGIITLFKHIIDYFKFHLYNKNLYIYLSFDLLNNNLFFPNKDNKLEFKIAELNDRDQIIYDIFPYLTFKEENDRMLINLIGNDTVLFCIGKINNKIIHYFIVFLDAYESPLIRTPLDKNLYNKNDVYLASTFTAPEARGMWVVPYSLAFIFNILKNTFKKNRCISLVHKSTPGAEIFYTKLGFQKF